MNTIILINNATNGGRTFTVTRRPATLTGASFADVGTDSVMESSVSSATATGGTIVNIITLDKLSTRSIEFDKYELELSPDDKLHIEPSSATDTQMIITWFEDK